MKRVATPSAPIIGGDPRPKLARGTREALRPAAGGALVEHQMGMLWLSSLRVEQLARNIATAAGLEFAYRLGRAHDDFEALRKKP